MAAIDIKFHFIRGEEVVTVEEEFEVDSNLECALEEFADDYASEHDIEFDEHEVKYYDNDFADPVFFANLDDYGAYVEECERHGEGYVLRYEDVGEHDFENEYAGCWRDDEEFVRDMIEDQIDIPSYVAVDWERTTRDVMMDYSAYEGSEGTHVFRD